MAEKSINALTNLDTLGVSLVRRGANKRKFAITKSEEGVMDEKAIELLTTVLKEAGYEGEDKILEQLKKAQMDEKATGAVNGAIRILSAFSDNPEIKKLLDGLKAALGGESNPTPKAKEDKPMDEKDKKNPAYPAPMAKALELLPEDQRGMFAPVLKAMLDAAEGASAERIQKAEERATATEAILKSERDARLVKEYVSKAATEFDKVPGKPEELGLVLKALNDANPELCKKVESILKSAQAALKESAIFVEKGRQGENVNGDDSWSSIEKAAEASAQ